MSASDNEDAAIAAEYVIGVLPQAERIAFRRRLAQDSALSAEVAAWEAHFATLNPRYGAVRPPARVKTAIDGRLFSDAPRRWWLWRPLGFGVATVALGLALALGLPQAFRSPEPTLQAQLASAETPYRFWVRAEADDAVSVALTAGDLPAGRVFELWLIPEGGAPVSLGAFDGLTRLKTPQALSAGATLAVSLEPTGGSPTGAPTGPVLAVGALGDV